MPADEQPGVDHYEELPSVPSRTMAESKLLEAELEAETELEVNDKIETPPIATPLPNDYETLDFKFPVDDQEEASPQEDGIEKTRL